MSRTAPHAGHLARMPACSSRDCSFLPQWQVTVIDMAPTIVSGIPSGCELFSSESALADGNRIITTVNIFSFHRTNGSIGNVDRRRLVHAWSGGPDLRAVGPD